MLSFEAVFVLVGALEALLRECGLYGYLSM